MAAFKLDRNLKEYATDSQWEKLTALESYGSERKAAKALGVHHRSISKAKSQVIKKAAQKGYCPERDLVHPVAPGMSSKGTSLRYNAAGEVEQYWNKTKQEGRDPDEVVKLNNATIVKVSTLYDQEGMVTQQWVAEKPEAVAKLNAWQEVAKALAEDLPKVEPVEYEGNSSEQDDLLAVYPIGDHHMGMLAWDKETGDDWDLSIAEEVLCQASDYLMDGCSNAKDSLLVFLGDFMHYDSFKAVTPSSGNLLDVDSRFPKMVGAAIRTMRYMITGALKRHQTVTVIVEIGNHDLSSSIFLMQCLANIYENDERVTIDTSPIHYHYFKYGQTLIGTHHGHGTPMKNLPLIMANDRADEWGRTTYRYWYTGHIHHSKTQAAMSAQDFTGCSVESFRVLAAPDAWSHQNGYRAWRDMKAIVIHPYHGEVARFTVNQSMFEEE